MLGGADVNIFTKVSAETHRRLSVQAARLGISKEEIYRQALTWASRRRAFQDAMRKVYVSGKRK